MSASKSELLLCPFCHGRAVLKEIEREPDVGMCFPDYAVFCTQCGAVGPGGGSLDKGRKKAVELWNEAKR